jgi:hypothetical protein
MPNARLRERLAQRALLVAPGVYDMVSLRLADNGIGIAGIEFIVDRAGELYTYDVNTNTNYNGDAERAAGVSGMRAIAAYLGEELRALDARGHRAAA